MIPSLLRLLCFTKEGESVHRSALGQVIFPTFVHVYLDFVSGGHSDVGTFLFGGGDDCTVYSTDNMCETFHKVALGLENACLVSPSHIVFSTLATIFDARTMCERTDMT